MPRKPASDWKFFPCQIGKDVAFIYVDVAAQRDIDSSPGTLAKVRLTYKAPRSNGLPTNAEFEAAHAIEDKLERFARRGKDRYVGRITRGGYRIFYFYTRRKKQEWIALLDKLVDETGYELALATRADRAHAGYREELYPTLDDWQVINDIGVTEALRRQGDAAGTRRRIDHWACFKDPKAAARLVKWALARDFRHDTKLSGVIDGGVHCVRLYHVGTTRQAELSHHSVPLRQKAAELGGNYDGWETQVVRRRRARRAQS